MKTVSSVGKKILLQKVTLLYTCKISFNIWINETQLGLPPVCLHLVCLQLTCPEAPGRLSLWKGKVYFSAFVKQLWLKGPQFWDQPSSTESCFIVNITQHNIIGLIYHILCPQLEEKVKQDLDIFGSATWTKGAPFFSITGPPEGCKWVQSPAVQGKPASLLSSGAPRCSCHLDPPHPCVNKLKLPLV